MCISVPGEVLAVGDRAAEVCISGVKRSVLLAVDNVEVGDWVLVHSGIAVGKLDSAEAKETLALFSGLPRPGIDSIGKPGGD